MSARSLVSARLGLIMAMVTALSWAVLAIALKLALKSFSSGTIVWVRMIVATAILLFVFSWRHREWLSILRSPPWQGLLCGGLITLNYYGFMKGVELTSASNAQILIQLAPLSFAVISIFLYRETPTFMQAIGMMVAFSGFGFFYWDQILVSADRLAEFQTGNLWLLLAAASWTIFALIQKALIKSVAPQQLNLLIYACSALLLFPSSNMQELSHFSVGEGLLLLFLAVNTVVGYGALAEAIARIPASQVSMIIAVNPLLTIFIMTTLAQMEVEWLRAEPIHWRGFVGALLVVAGVILTVRKPVRLSR